MSINGKRIAVVGVGNLLLKDDGAGVHAVRMLESELPADVVLIDAGTAFLSALPEVEKADKILIIDSVQNGASPGSISFSAARDLISSDWTVSLEQPCFLNVLQFTAEGEEREILVLGVEAEEIGYGTELSGTVAEILPGVVAAAKEIVDIWRSPPLNSSDVPH